MSMTDEQYIKGGYSKMPSLTKAYVEEAHSRTTGPDGKVYRGEAGKQLKRRQLERQKYHERNS
jgi:hypothetical protein